MQSESLIKLGLLRATTQLHEQGEYARLGYGSRADALKNIDRCVTTKASLKQVLKTGSLHPNMTFLTECHAAFRRLAGGFGRSGSSRVMRNLLHNGLAAALIFFYSKNVLSSTARAFISF
jgi:hypothetical protein